MTNTLRNARNMRAAGGAARGGGLAALAGTVLSARNTAAGTLTAARARGGKELQPRKPTAQETARNREEQAALKKLASKKATNARSGKNTSAKSFDSAFRDARRAGVKTFSWNGKKYTTQMK
jgi:hypothetical protein